MPTVKTAEGFGFYIRSGRLILKDTQIPPHYWELKVETNAGGNNPQWTFKDLGIIEPT